MPIRFGEKFEGASGFQLTVAEGKTSGYSAGYTHVYCREEYGRFQ